MIETSLRASDGYNLLVAIYECKNAEGVILIMHGMEEHKERYDWFASSLSKKGFNVVINDMRGHGKDAPIQGYFSDKNGYQRLIDDYVELTNFIKEQYPDLPIYIVAHSMGTITARVLLQKHSFDYKKVVLSGYPNYNPGAIAGIFVCRCLSLTKGTKGHSKMLDKMVTGAFNKAIKDPKTNCDWLSYDENNVQKYLDDHLSGVPFTISGYKDLLKLMNLMHRKNLYKGINTCLPIYCVSGEDDPCTGGEKGRNDSIDKLRASGFSMVQVKTYKNMRHEILNEKEKDVVLDDIVSFIKS